MDKNKATKIFNRSQSRGDNIRDVMVIILVHFILFSIFYFLEGPLHSFMSNYTVLTYGPDHIDLKSEYTIGEQLSKLYLFTIILVAAFNYRVSQDPTKIKLSISFLALSFVMYLSESNIIAEQAQPLFGLMGITFTVFFLFRLGSWSSLTSFVIGFALIFLGVLTDVLGENENIRVMLPGFVNNFLHVTLEERFDVSGIAFICLSAILCFRSPLCDFIVNETKVSMFILISSGIITFGNGFLHYQYGPTDIHFILALGMTIIGYIGLIYSYRKIEYSFPKNAMISRKSIYLWVFFFFVILPAFHEYVGPWVAFLFWLPSIIYMVIYLWRCHPIHQSEAK